MPKKPRKVSGEARNAARQRFLQIIPTMAPQVLATLHHDVLPSFRALFNEAGPLCVPKARLLLTADQPRGHYVLDAEPWLTDDYAGLLERLPNGSQHRTDFITAFEGWSSKWWLLESWQREQALETLKAWTFFRTDAKPADGWQFVGGSVRAGIALPNISPWDGAPGTRAKYLAMVKQRYAQYCDDIEFARRRGRRGDSPQDIDRAIRWVVRQQVLGHTQQAIANKEKLEWKSVGEAIRETRDVLLGIERPRRITRSSPRKVLAKSRQLSRVQ